MLNNRGRNVIKPMRLACDSCQNASNLTLRYIILHYNWHFKNSTYEISREKGRKGLYGQLQLTLGLGTGAIGQKPWVFKLHRTRGPDYSAAGFRNSNCSHRLTMMLFTDWLEGGGFSGSGKGVGLRVMKQWLGIMFFTVPLNRMN